MNGYGDHRMGTGDFDEKSGLNGGLRTFDAFPKTKTTYTTRHARGGQWTVILLVTCALLSFSELRRWYHGHETHHFSVEKGVGHTMQINLDIVVAMHCEDLHVNVQDASGDLILAGQLLRKDETSWRQWSDARGMHTLGAAQEDDHLEDGGDHVADVMGLVGGTGGIWNKKAFKKTPRLRGAGGACRIFGSMEVNRVQGDFHITARGHGYMEFGAHLDHSAFNFSHVVNELSFGPYYPKLHNPLDATIALTPAHFYKFQYYVSIVPTIYTSTSSSTSFDSTMMMGRRGKTVFTNQYAVTEQSHLIGERSVPGVFFKFDIEPILLLIREERTGFMRLLVRIVNVVSGVLVAGGWCYLFAGWAWTASVLGRWGRRGGLGRRGKRKSEGVLNGRSVGGDEDDDE